MTMLSISKGNLTIRVVYESGVYKLQQLVEGYKIGEVPYISMASAREAAVALC